MIQFTEKATQMVAELRASNPDWKNLNLRLYLSGKGCDGFEYGVCFDSHLDGDTTYEFKGFSLYVDKETLDFVQGSSIDWAETEEGKGFLVNNPNHKKFRGKFFKREGWREKILNKEASI